jgi:hypothetical protein
MSDWQKILRDDSISTLDELKAYVTERFGADAAEREIDVEALKPAFDNFQMRITRESLSQITDVGDANWNQFIPTVQELEIVDGVIDSLDEDGDSPVPNITHRYPDRVPLPRQPGLRELLPLLHQAAQGRRPREDPAQPVRVGVRVHRGAPGGARQSSCRAATR